MKMNNANKLEDPENLYIPGFIAFNCNLEPVHADNDFIMYLQYNDDFYKMIVLDWINSYLGYCLKQDY